ncbi:hypothetical protein SLS56_011821 [Neofusicoccum ribis]|uniref:Uncharacterized protein n=1 Tax=Neofusicoccum ribis TaxID=45134 RepID=A0ABR3SAL6_9PEZI
MTIITRYDVKTQKSIILLKYRSYNDLPSHLQTGLIEKLKELVRQPSTTKLADNPFALSLFHFSSTIQYYRRAARDPRDTIRKEEKKVHEKSDAVDLRMIHLALASLEQDKIQLNFILELINQLRKQHDRFFRKVKRMPNPDERGWSYVRVEEDLDRFENQVAYFRNSVQDVACRAQRLLDLLFNLSSAKVAEQAMYESASMSTISVVTMLFLPGSFVAGILGTNLFTGPTKPDPSSGDISSGAGRGLYVSDQWWLLLAVIGPVTLLTFMGWHLWKKFTRLKIKQKLLMAEIV